MKLSHIHVLANVIQEVQSWTEEFEVTLFDRDKELYHDFLKARSQKHACEVALEFAQIFFPECNRIHVERLEVHCRKTR